jgi:hypothetical protein
MSQAYRVSLISLITRRKSYIGMMPRRNPYKEVMAKSEMLSAFALFLEKD